jgi:hypothetical protein
MTREDERNTETQRHRESSNMGDPTKKSKDRRGIWQPECPRKECLDLQRDAYQRKEG